MDAVTILFNTISGMTGGLITDVTTVCVALVVVGFICMGIDLVTMPMREAMGEKVAWNEYNKKRKRADGFAERYEREKNFVGAQPKKGWFK